MPNTVWVPEIQIVKSLLSWRFYSSLFWTRKSILVGVKCCKGDTSRRKRWWERRVCICLCLSRDLIYVVLCPLTMRIGSEKCIIRWFHHCASVIECAPTHTFDGIAHCCNCLYFYTAGSAGRFTPSPPQTRVVGALCCDVTVAAIGVFQLHYRLRGPPVS